MWALGNFNLLRCGAAAAPVGPAVPPAGMQEEKILPALGCCQRGCQRVGVGETLSSS